MTRYCLFFLGLMGGVMGSPVSADLADVLLPNGEPIVGVYYYPWFHGPPFQHVGWTPEFEYDNVNNPAHIRAVLKAITDYGINHAAFSYWNNTGSLEVLRRTFEQNRHLFAARRRLYLSPYLEPPTLDERYGDPAAQQHNIDFISTYLEALGREPSFARLGGRHFTNLYVAYYVPTGTDAEFQAFLRQRYPSLVALNAAWDSTYSAWEEITMGDAKPGTRAFVDLQEWRAARLREGWGKTIAGIKERTGFDTAYTGDNSNPRLSLTEYLPALTGLTWYSFGYALTNPYRWPKVVSEVAKYTDTTFLYTLSPGYVDRQQRWGGGRVEGEPFLYPYAWCQALSTLPDGIMILTHTEWFEGSIIEVTKEYGKKYYELTELYSSLFRSGFADLYRRKHTPHRLAVVYNEYTPFRLYERGHGQGDTLGLVKVLETLSQEFDVLPEARLVPTELKQREVLLVPNCGIGLAPESNEAVWTWLTTQPNRLALVTLSRWWAERLGFTVSEEPVDIQRYFFRRYNLVDTSENLNLVDVGEGQVLVAGRNGVPKIVARRLDNGSTVLFFNGRFGEEFLNAFFLAAEKGEIPTGMCWLVETLLQTFDPHYERPSSSYEIKRATPFAAENTLLLPAANVLPWGYITEHRAVGWGLGKGHSAEDTQPWERQAVTFTVDLPRADLPVAEVQVVDSDSGRFQPLKEYQQEGTRLQFTYPLKFHALFAVVQGPVQLQVDELLIHPGERRTFAARLKNLQRTAIARGRIRLRAGPGLHLQPVRFGLGGWEETSVELTLQADRDYATGRRTVVLEVETDGEKALFWRPLTCIPGPMLATRTTRVGGPGGQEVPAEIAVVNIGGDAAENVRLRLGESEAPVERLAAGEETLLSLAVQMPEVPVPSIPSPKEVSIILGAEPQEKGLTVIRPQEGDGQVKVVTRAGVEALMPDVAKSHDTLSVRYLYFRVADEVFPPGDYYLKAEIEYFDEGRGTFLVEYDSTAGEDIESRYKDSATVRLRDTKRWCTARLTLPDAHFAGRENYGADFRLNGVVAVRRVTLRTQIPPQERTVETEMVATYTAYGEEREERLPLRIVSLSPETPRPSSVPLGAIPIVVVNPYDFNTGVSWPLRVQVPDTPLQSLNRLRIAVFDEQGQRLTHALRGDELCFTARLRGPVTVFYVSDRAASTSKSDVALRVYDYTEGPEGYLALQNGSLALLWDERRAGMLVSCKSLETGTDYAAFPTGAVVAEYERADGQQVVLNRGRGEVRLQRQTPAEVVVSCAAEDDTLAVRDVWHVYANSPVLRLERTVRLKKKGVRDVVPLALHLDPEPFERVLPLGVGFVSPEGVKRGWLETWHLADGYFCYGGNPRAAHDAVGLALESKSPVRRVRYGFIGDELQLRLRARKPFYPQTEWKLKVWLFAGSQVDYHYPKELRLLALSPPIVRVGWKNWTLSGPQTIPPRAPVYMYEVRRPYW
ncbi:MAG TPA: hypothetical protein EYP85_14530 [Armatimonadetes bacterium]|nr:hypothetical protein [Armatimonadota bacterium]